MSGYIQAEPRCPFGWYCFRPGTYPCQIAQPIRAGCRRTMNEALVTCFVNAVRRMETLQPCTVTCFRMTPIALPPQLPNGCWSKWHACVPLCSGTYTIHAGFPPYLVLAGTSLLPVMHLVCSATGASSFWCPPYPFLCRTLSQQCAVVHLTCISLRRS